MSILWLVCLVRANGECEVWEAIKSSAETTVDFEKGFAKEKTAWYHAEIVQPVPSKLSLRQKSTHNFAQ